ncbi:MAG: aldo/keto reductase, partial [Acidisphaera sp.]|nr:aldo/keto reductase [Acidisphaera sp.]
MDSDAFTLNDGRPMPRFGFGVWQISPAETAAAVAAAFDAGFRLIDTAAGYGNEAEVGQAVKAGTVPRDAVFVTTKLANQNHGFDEALQAFDKSL